MASNDKGLEEIPEGMRSHLNHANLCARRGEVRVCLTTAQESQPLIFGTTTGQIESNYDEITDSFDSMQLKSELLRGTLLFIHILPLISVISSILTLRRCICLWV